jgi:hypothetical protein
MNKLKICVAGATGWGGITQAAPNVNGVLLAICEVGKLVSVHRGLDRVMKF